MSIGVGAMVPLVTTFIAQWFRAYPGGYVPAFVFLCGCVGFILGVLNSRPAKPRLHCAFFSVPFGVVIDAEVHLNLHGYVYDHNLLPFEAVFLMIIAALPLYGAGWLGRRTAARLAAR